MIGNRITHRTADGVRIPGTWRHAFIRNGGRYFLTDLPAAPSMAMGPSSRTLREQLGAGRGAGQPV
jgi:hypothetical protein